MAFSMQCISKNCGQIQNPYIDPVTNKVYCSICDGEITNATHFTKMQMKASKQFKEKKQKSFCVKCKKCSFEDRPVKNNGKYSCKKCNQELDVPYAFRMILDHYLPSADKEI